MKKIKNEACVQADSARSTQEHIVLVQQPSQPSRARALLTLARHRLWRVGPRRQPLLISCLLSPAVPPTVNRARPASETATHHTRSFHHNHVGPTCRSPSSPANSHGDFRNHRAIVTTSRSRLAPTAESSTSAYKTWAPHPIGACSVRPIQRGIGGV